LHQYQQNKQLPLTLNDWTQKRGGTTIYDVGNPGPCLEQARKMWVFF